MKYEHKKETFRGMVMKRQIRIEILTYKICYYQSHNFRRISLRH